MPNLTIISGEKKTEYHFEGHINLAEALCAAGYPMVQPCGGRGVCGKCAVSVKGELSEADCQERAMNRRLACRTILLGDAVVEFADCGTLRQIETRGSANPVALQPFGIDYGTAIDIGTTTIAAKLFDLATGAECATAASINPQTRVAADVMGRISAALGGALDYLNQLISEAVSEIIKALCLSAGINEKQVSCLVITGNTTMLYLLTGKNPETLSHFPFEADCLFGYTTAAFGRRVCFPACMNAFVGADITCAVLASGLTDRKKTALLCDIGTNGEMALWKDGRLIVTSTAAGPAFEGAGISCGCGSISGAIDRVTLEGDKIVVNTIENAPAVGICGSGLIDAVACLLKLGKIDETGAVDDDELPLSDGVVLMPKDVRAVQLAKAAIAAGMITLMETADVKAEEIHSLYIAGGFGSHLNVKSAIDIGMIPKALAEKISIIGNGALSGAQKMLLNTDMIRKGERIARLSEHVDLGGNPRFNHHYMEQMMFPEQN